MGHGKTDGLGHLVCNLLQSLRLLPIVGLAGQGWAEQEYAVMVRTTIQSYAHERVASPWTTCMDDFKPAVYQQAHRARLCLQRPH